MKQVRVFQDCTREYVLSEMHKYSFTKMSGLMLNPGLSVSMDQISQLVNSKDGTIIAMRSKVFFFWQKECLVEQTNSLGKLFTWYPKSKLVYISKK